MKDVQLGWDSESKKPLRIYVQDSFGAAQAELTVVEAVALLHELENLFPKGQSGPDGMGSPEGWDYNH